MLWTAEHNVTAQRLFDRLGFRRTMIEMTLELKRRPPTETPAANRISLPELSYHALSFGPVTASEGL
jgi:ribosomal protein S18 acetylase RimI-like enzyme